MKLKFTLSVVLAMAAVGGLACRHASPATTAEIKTPIYYTCPMHPSVKVGTPGDCPLCGMKLTPAFAETDSGSAAPCRANCCAAPTAKP